MCNSFTFGLLFVFIFANIFVFIIFFQSLLIRKAPFRAPYTVIVVLIVLIVLSESYFWIVVWKLLFPCRDADAGPVPAPRRVTGEALQTQEGPDGLLRLATVRPGEKIRNPAVSVHAGESGAGHRAEPVRDAGTSAHARTNGKKYTDKTENKTCAQKTRNSKVNGLYSG